MRTVRVIDSHTEGEPTRVVVGGGPELLGETLREMRADFSARFDEFRTGVVLEPRGGEAVVGALLTRAVTPEALCGVIFFNNVGYLGMCGHGSIGVARTLQHLGRMGSGRAIFDTPEGPVAAEALLDGRVAIENVESYVFQSDVCVRACGKDWRGTVTYGGNWFFQCAVERSPTYAERELWLETAQAVRRALEAEGVTGDSGAEIDHIEFVGPPERSDADAKSFVLCPGGAYDRSPCGTGLSAKLAVLAAEGRLLPGEVFRMEGLCGGVFEGSYRRSSEGRVIPRIVGRAYLTSESHLLFEDDDPFAGGIWR